LARGFLIVAHFNHGLRGAESDADQTFVGDLAHRLNLRFESAVALGTARDEATLRDQRLDFLAATASRSGARYVALAHTIDDNVETVLHHLLRGTGPAGLAGIAEARAWRDDLVLMRPLLAARRADLRIGLRQIDQAWREDSSNLNLDYRRNWIRGELIPLIQSQYPQAVPAIGRAIAGQQQWRRTIESLAVQWLAEHQLPPGGPMPAQPSSSQTAAAQATAPQRAVGNSVALRRDATIEPAIVIAALQGVWEQQNWPRRAMARTHWTRLAATVRGSDCERYSLPAAIDVIADTASVTVVGPRQSERDLLSLADST
jgi:tRNA(Ile)-lysidine synthase